MTAMALVLKTKICNKMGAFQIQHEEGITLMSIKRVILHLDIVAFSVYFLI